MVLAVSNVDTVAALVVGVSNDVPLPVYRYESSCLRETVEHSPHRTRAPSDTFLTLFRL